MVVDDLLLNLGIEDFDGDRDGLALWRDEAAIDGGAELGRYQEESRVGEGLVFRFTFYVFFYASAVLCMHNQCCCGWLCFLL